MQPNGGLAMWSRSGRWVVGAFLAGAALVVMPSCALLAPSMSTLSTGSGHVQVVRPSLSFGIRSVLAQSTGRTGSLARTPFTLGVIAPDDPYRDDPGFSEAPIDAGGGLVTFSDSDRNGFYDPATEAKWMLGQAVVTGDEVRSAQAVHSSRGWSLDLQLDGRGIAALRSFTRSTMGSQDAFVVDDRVVAAPTVHGVVTNGALQVSGLPASEVKRLAAALNGRSWAEMTTIHC